MDYVVFMKYGTHAGEGADRIIKRKNEEYSETNRIYWGYNGTLCHPTTQVQPFAQEATRSGKSVYLALSPTSSAPRITSEEATHYSSDKENWNSLPPGAKVTGSKYALVCGKLQKRSEKIDLSEYSVGVGNSKGTPAPNYIKGQVDKGCLIRKKDGSSSEIPFSQSIQIDWISRLVQPYSIFLK